VCVHIIVVWSLDDDPRLRSKLVTVWYISWQIVCCLLENVGSYRVRWCWLYVGVHRASCRAVEARRCVRQQFNTADGLVADPLAHFSSSSPRPAT
jgi:hypothetical protein